MKKVFIFFLLIISTNIYSQVETKGNDLRSLKKKVFLNDTVVKKLIAMRDSTLESMRKEEAQRFTESNQANLESFINEQKESNAKAKRSALIRIGIGIALFGVLIAGLLRRRKKQ